MSFRVRVSIALAGCLSLTLVGVGISAAQPASAAIGRTSAPPPRCIPPDCPPPPPCGATEGPQTLSGFSLAESNSFQSTSFDSTHWYNWGSPPDGTSGTDDPDGATSFDFDGTTQQPGYFNSNELTPTDDGLFFSNAQSGSNTYETENSSDTGTVTEDAIDTDGIQGKLQQVYGAYDWCAEAPSEDSGLSGVLHPLYATLDTAALLWPALQTIESVTVASGVGTVTMSTAHGFTNNMTVQILDTTTLNYTFQMTTTGTTTFTYTPAPGTADTTCTVSMDTPNCGSVQAWPPEIDFAESPGNSGNYHMFDHFYDMHGNAVTIGLLANSASQPNIDTWNEYQARWTPSAILLLENDSIVAELASGSGTDLPTTCTIAEQNCYKIYSQNLPTMDQSNFIPATPMQFDYEQGAFDGAALDSSELTGIGWMSQFAYGSG